MAYRIFNLITTLGQGGAETFLCRLLPGLRAEGLDCSVAYLTGSGPLAECLTSVNIPVTRLDLNGVTGCARGLFHLAEVIRKYRPHLIQTWLYHSDLLGLFARGISGTRKLIWNVQCSNMEFSHYRLRSRLIFRTLATFSFAPDAVIYNSHVGSRVHRAAGYSSAREAIISSGVDTELFCPDNERRLSFRQRFGISTDAIVVSMVARFDAQKDPRTFLEAASRVLAMRRDRELYFILVGRGMDRENPELRAMLAETRMIGEQRLIFAGAQRQIESILAGVDVNCMSSAFGEGCPNAILEAMACGVPCVVTDVGDAAFIVGETGLVVPPRAPEALAQAIEQIVDRGEVSRHNLGRVAAQRIRDEFSLQIATTKYAQLLLEIVES